MSERYAVGTQVRVKNNGQGSQYRKPGEHVGAFEGVVIANNGPDYTGIPEVCVQSETGARRVLLVGDLEEVPVTPEPVIEYSVKIWYRSGAYEGVAHSPEDLARKIFADAVKSAGVEFAELHGPSGKLVESRGPGRCTSLTAVRVGLSRTTRCELNSGHVGRHSYGGFTWPNEERLVSQQGEDLTAAYSPQDPAEPTA